MTGLAGLSGTGGAGAGWSRGREPARRTGATSADNGEPTDDQARCTRREGRRRVPMWCSPFSGERGRTPPKCGRKPLQAVPDGSSPVAVVPRTIRLVLSSRWTPPVPRRRRCRPARRSTAARPPAAMGMATVVNGGAQTAEYNRSSKPTTLISVGTRPPVGEPGQYAEGHQVVVGDDGGDAAGERQIRRLHATFELRLKRSEVDDLHRCRRGGGRGARAGAPGWTTTWCGPFRYAQRR